MIPLLVNDLLVETAPIVLVLDDYHLITDPHIHETAALLLGPPATRSCTSWWCARGEVRAAGEQTARCGRAVGTCVPTSWRF